MRSTQLGEYYPSESGSMFGGSFGSNVGEEKDYGNEVVISGVTIDPFFYATSPIPNNLMQRRKRKSSNFDELVTGAVDRTKRTCVTRSDQRVLIPVELGILGADVDAGLIQLNDTTQRGRPRDNEDEKNDDSEEDCENQDINADEDSEEEEESRISDMARLQRPRLALESPSSGVPFLTPDSGSLGLASLRLHSASLGPIVSPFSPTFALMRVDQTSPGSDHSDMISPSIWRRSIHTNLATLSPEAVTFIPIPHTQTPHNSLASGASLINQVDEDSTESVDTESDLEELIFDGFGFYDIDEDDRINGGHPI